jgi:hypothetical protein
VKNKKLGDHDTIFDLSSLNVSHDVTLPFVAKYKEKREKERKSQRGSLDGNSIFFR